MNISKFLRTAFFTEHQWWLSPLLVFFVLIHQNKEKSIGNPSSDPRQHSPSLPRSASSVLQTLSMAQSETPTMLQEEITEETNKFWTKIQKEEQIR